jgi:hypothetical protein
VALDLALGAISGLAFLDSVLAVSEQVAIELHENAKAIEAWRAILPERQRRRLVHPLSNVRRWRRETQQGTEPHHSDVAPALAAWRRFVSCVESLPARQTAPLWEIALPEVLGNLGMSAVPQQATSI